MLVGVEHLGAFVPAAVDAGLIRVGTKVLACSVVLAELPYEYGNREGDCKEKAGNCDPSTI